MNNGCRMRGEEEDLRLRVGGVSGESVMAVHASSLDTCRNDPMSDIVFLSVKDWREYFPERANRVQAQSEGRVRPKDKLIVSCDAILKDDTHKHLFSTGSSFQSPLVWLGTSRRRDTHP